MAWENFEVSWEARCPADYDERKKSLLEHGLLARVSFWRDVEGLFGLKVEPIQRPLMSEPGNKLTPWHISVAFDDAGAKELQGQFSMPRDVNLKFDYISWGAVATLSPKCPIGGHPVVRRLHSLDPWYGGRHLHISF